MQRRHTFWALIGGGLPSIAAVLAVPVLIHQLGFQIFSIVSLVISLNLFFYVYDFGFWRAMTFFVARLEIGKSQESIQILTYGLLLSVVIGILVGLLIYFGSPYVVTHWMKVPDELLKDAVLAFQIASLGILPSVVANMFKGVLEGRKSFKEANICKIFSGSTLFFVPLLLVVFFESVTIAEISAYLVVSRYIALGMYFKYVGSFKLSSGGSRVIEASSRYIFWAAISGFFATMFIYGDRFIVAGYLSADDLSIYIASQDILIRFLLLPWSMVVVLMPVFSAVKQDKLEAKRLYAKQSLMVIWLALAFLVGVALLAVFGTPYLASYGIPNETNMVVLIQGVGIFFCSLSQLPLVYLYARGRPRMITSIFVLEAMLYLLVAPAIFEHFGVIGASFVWSSRLIIESALLNICARRVLNGV